MPTLVICGGNDWITPLSKSEEIVAGIPGSRLEVFEASGHMPMIEEPEKFISVLRSFLAEDGTGRRSANREIGSNRRMPPGRIERPHAV